MKDLIIRRLIESLMVVFLVTIMVFFAMRFLPGDPVLVYVSQNEVNSATPEQIEKIRREFGLDKPTVVQYINWLGDICRGNLGRSVIHRTSVNEEIGRALPKTIYLGSAAFILSIILGIPLGIVAAIRRGKWVDALSTLVANLGVTAPIFWVGIILILIFGYYLRWLPIQGWVPPTENLRKESPPHPHAGHLSDRLSNGIRRPPDPFSDAGGYPPGLYSDSLGEGIK